MWSTRIGCIPIGRPRCISDAVVMVDHEGYSWCHHHTRLRYGADDDRISMHDVMTTVSTRIVQVHAFARDTVAQCESLPGVCETLFRVAHNRYCAMRIDPDRDRNGRVSATVFDVPDRLSGKGSECVVSAKHTRSVDGRRNFRVAHGIFCKT